MTQNRKQKIGDSFGKQVISYNRHASLQKKCAQKLCGFLPDTNPLRILEIGCGTGFLTEELQSKYPKAEILGIDISKEMIFSCSQKFTGYQNLSFQIADGENFNSTEKFDLIISNLTIQWFEHPVQGLQNLCKNLKDNGKLFFSTIGQKSFQEWENILENLKLPSGILPAPSYDGIFEENERIIKYQNTINFLQSFKKIGAHQPREGYKPLSRTDLQCACKAFDTVHQGNITWHILYGCLDSSGRAGFCQNI